MTAGWPAFVAIVLAAALASVSPAGGDSAAAAAPAMRLPNERCPVLPEEAADPAFHAVHAGRDVYFCCATCRRKFLDDPRPYLANLPQFGGAPPVAAVSSGTPQPAASVPAARQVTLRGWLGRAHPVLVHFPIALLLGALAAQLLAVSGGWDTAQRAVDFLVLAAAPASVAAALVGLALAADTTVPPDLTATMSRHRLAGVAAAGLAVACAAALPWRRARGFRRTAFLALLALAGGLVAVAGHWGAVLVWGADWLPL